MSFQSIISNFVRKCLVRISFGKFSKISKTSAVESFLNQIIGINSRPAALLKRSFHQGGFPVNILKLSAILQKSLAWTLFSVCLLCFKRSKLCKTLVHHWIFSQNILFKTTGFRNIFQKSPWRSLFVVES